MCSGIWRATSILLLSGYITFCLHTMPISALECCLCKKERLLTLPLQGCQTGAIACAEWQLSTQSACSVTGVHVQACRGACRPEMGQHYICKGEHALFRCQRKPHVAAACLWHVSCGLSKALPSTQALLCMMHPAVCSTFVP